MNTNNNTYNNVCNVDHTSTTGSTESPIVQPTGNENVNSNSENNSMDDLLGFDVFNGNIYINIIYFHKYTYILI